MVTLLVTGSRPVAGIQSSFVVTFDIAGIGASRGIANAER